MTASLGFNEITASLDNLPRRLANPEVVLYEVGKMIERIAIHELEKNRFCSPLSPSYLLPLREKPFTKYRWPISKPSRFDGLLSANSSRGVYISEITPDSVTVSMPREVVGKISMRLSEIEEFMAEYILASLKGA